VKYGAFGFSVFKISVCRVFKGLGFYDNHAPTVDCLYIIVKLNTVISNWLYFLFLSKIVEQHIYYVFCLLKLDGQVLDTALVETDESETDISFDNIIVLWVFVNF